MGFYSFVAIKKQNKPLAPDKKMILPEEEG